MSTFSTISDVAGTRSFGLSERMDKLRSLFGHLKSLWTEPSMRPPMIRLFVARTLFYLLPGMALLVAAAGNLVTTALLAVGAMVVRGPLLIYDAFQRGRLAHLFAAHSRGQPSDAAGAKQAIKGKGGRLFFVSFLEWLERKLQRSDGDGGFLQAILAAVAGEVLDVAGAYLLPAVVLDDVRVTESIDELKELRDHIPATLVASAGFDAATGLLSQFFWGPAAFLFLAVVAGVIAQVVTMTTGLLILGIAALLLAAPLAGLQALRESAKAVYFTALYMLVAHREEVAADREGALQGLVQLADPEEGTGSPSGSRTNG